MFAASQTEISAIRNLSHQNITVRFKVNDFDTVAQVYPSNSTIGSVLDDIASKFHLSSKHVTIKREKHLTKLPKGIQLDKMCKNNFRIVDVELMLSDLAQRINEGISNDYERIRLDMDLYYRQYQLPDFISVTVPDDNDTTGANTKRVVVEIINVPIAKPFLGGYVNKLTSIEYHNAYTQTGPTLDQIRIEGLVTRDTQTAELCTTETDKGFNPSSYEKPTQKVEETEKLILLKGERVLAAKEYISLISLDKVTDDEHKKIVLIQRNFRRYLWQKLIRNSAAQWRRFKYNCETNGSPRTKKDFEMAVANVGQWKENRLKFIKEHFSDKAQRKIEYKSLLQKEINLLNEIDRKRSKIRKKLAEKETEEFLDQLGLPIRWIGYKNTLCEMDLLRTQKIRQLTTLYRQLKVSNAKFDRIEFITGLGGVLKREPNSPILNELIDLLGREQKLLMANINDADLNTLRSRQNELFVNFIASSKVCKLKANTSQVKSCIKCKAICSPNHLELNNCNAVGNETSICKICNKPDVDVSIYEAILRAICRDERKRNSVSSCAFIIQEEDIRKIVEQIWHGHSILSQHNDRIDLRLPRWQKDKDWAPWNCICLTKTEAVAHNKIENVSHAYGNHLIRLIENNNKLAKSVLSQLKHFDV